MYRPPLHTVLGVALAASLTACGTDSTAPSSSRLSDAQVNSDIATTEGDAIADDAALFGSDESAAAGSLAVATSGARLSAAMTDGCTYDPESGRFTCPEVQFRGATLLRSYELFDAAGQPMPAYDPSLTASIEVWTQLDGQREGLTFTNHFHRTRDHVVSGLAGDETQRTWDGTGASTDTATRSGVIGTRSYRGESHDTVTAVIVELPRADHPYPLSGTIVHRRTGTATLTGAQTVSRQIDRRVSVTFNGTAEVPLSIGQFMCTLHLDTHEVTGCSGS